jgi:ATP-binding cassette subfamily C exporter for protease/lipase
MGMVANLRRHWLGRHENNLAATQAAQSLTNRITAFSKLLRYIQQSASLGVGALLVIWGELSPGAMIAANVLMTRALAPIDQIVATWKSFITAREGFKRLSILLDRHPERDPALKRARPGGELVLQGVTATAPGRKQPILDGIDLTVPSGSVLVVLGPSGSGKSTLARVMLGIWGDVRGEVLLDGRPVEGWDRTDLGPHIGYLPQDIELFDGSIAENIARFGHLDSERIIAAAQATGLHEMILRFPKGYDTPMGEAGSLLSGGQRQRVALARAVYGDPALIVLDEPNANLDDAGEAALARAVMELKKRGSTVVLITHRPSAIGVADRLLLLKDGKVFREGPRDEVLAALRPPTAPSTTSPQNPVAPAQPAQP